MVTTDYVKDFNKLVRESASRIDSSYRDLYSNNKGFIMSSMVPPVKVSDPVVQQMIDDISSVLRGVNGKYFPSIRYINAERRGNEYIILYAAEGRGFRLGVVCGTDGSFSGFQCITNSGKSRSKVHPINTPDDLRLALDQIGADLNRRR